MKRSNILEFFSITILSEDPSKLLEDLLKAKELYPEYVVFNSKLHSLDKCIESSLLFGEGSYIGNLKLVKIKEVSNET